MDCASSVQLIMPQNSLISGNSPKPVKAAEAVKVRMPGVAIGRHVRQKAEGFELRESRSSYTAFFVPERTIWTVKASGLGVNKKEHLNADLVRPQLTTRKSWLKALSSMKAKTKQYIGSWIEKANNDLKNADLVLAASDDAIPYDTVCFHCQQSVEKYLKAFLVYCDVAYPQSHNLSDLVAKCRQTVHLTIINYHDILIGPIPNRNSSVPVLSVLQE